MLAGVHRRSKAVQCHTILCSSRHHLQRTAACISACPMIPSVNRRSLPFIAGAQQGHLSEHFAGLLELDAMARISFDAFRAD